MALDTKTVVDGFDFQFNPFCGLMRHRVKNILWVSTPYDAWIMETDCRISERIVNEYRDLNLSQPPCLSWVSSTRQALDALDGKRFEMVITMPGLADMAGQAIKQKVPGLPVVQLLHDTIPSPDINPLGEAAGIDRTFVWSGNTNLFVALIKCTEDRMNVEPDVESGGVRVILVVEDSPYYLSLLMPILYRELLGQTRAVLETTLDEARRQVTMRARPKILVAGGYEEALTLFGCFEANILGVISAVGISRNGTLDESAGVEFLRQVQARRLDIPLLLTSSDPVDATRAASIHATFADTGSAMIRRDIRRFFKDRLGFGDFVFQMPDGSEIGRAATVKALDQHLRAIPDASFSYHCQRNDFSRWLFVRNETDLAAKVRSIRDQGVSDAGDHRRRLVQIITDWRKQRRKGSIADFDADDMDLDSDLSKIGNGSLGGKARGLAFVAALLHQNPDIGNAYPGVDIMIPQTLVITTDGFISFVENNRLRRLSETDLPDEKIAQIFINARFPEWIEDHLRDYLARVDSPLAVRSSSLLEDAQYRAYAGLYRSYMITNDCPDLEQRLRHLIHAIKLVYASTYYKGPRAFSRRVGHLTKEEQMAVIIQKLVGARYGDSFYPAISGVAQSHNYYPFSRMKPDEGIATIAMGLGKTVVDGEKTLRFSPAHPQVLPQRSTVEDILENAQRLFYALKMERTCHALEPDDSANLWHREAEEAENEPPMQLLASTYVPEEHRIRDTVHVPGQRVITFAHILKYNAFPLADILKDLLKLGERGMGCPVEMEFSVNLTTTAGEASQFALLQLRPMTARKGLERIDISPREIDGALCFAGKALGNAIEQDMADIVFVKPEALDPAQTAEIARQIARINAMLVKEGRKYLLIGPGRWGSADRWLGIPVAWDDISGVGAVVETEADQLSAEPSQGSHFFHNITTLGISYLTVSRSVGGNIDWNWLSRQPRLNDAAYVAHVRLDAPVTLKVDGRRSQGVIVLDKAMNSDWRKNAPGCQQG